MPESLADYDGTVHLLVNPTSTSYHRVAREAIGDLMLGMPGRVHVMYTSEKPANTRDQIAAQVHEGDIFISAGGDGSDRLPVETFLTHPDIDETARRVPILSYYGGNANMGPAELTPRVGLKLPSIMDVITHGVIVDVHPFEVTINPNNDLTPEDQELFELEKHIALYFAGLGASGLSAVELDIVRKHPWRQTPLGRNMIDGPAVLRGLKSSRHELFDFTEMVASDRDIRTDIHTRAYAADLINGRRFAKYGRFPTGLEEDRFYKVVLEDNRLHKVAHNVAKMLRGTLEGEIIEGNQIVSFDYRARRQNDAIWGQLDGDKHLLPPKGSFSVKHHDQAYRAVTTKPHLITTD